MSISPTVPYHVGIIPDGTRRWAHQQQIAHVDAYMRMFELLTHWITTLFEQETSVISIYLMSTENLERPPDNFAAGIEASLAFFTRMLPPVLTHYHAQAIHAGRRELLPDVYDEAMLALCTDSATNSKRRLYLLAAYNPFDELVATGANMTDLTHPLTRLWVPEPLDVVIRTSGEQRISGFLPLQASYAELLFLPDAFNAITPTQITDILTQYQSRKRRFGR